MEKVAPGVIARQHVDQPVQTGLKCIDSMIPVGRGQESLLPETDKPAKLLLRWMLLLIRLSRALNALCGDRPKEFSVANVV